MSTEIDWTVVRVFGRVWAPIQERLEMGAYMDAQFDGGEWSGPINVNTEQRMYDECAERVAAAFKMELTKLVTMIEIANYVSYDRFIEAVTLKERSKS